MFFNALTRGTEDPSVAYVFETTRPHVRNVSQEICSIPVRSDTFVEIHSDHEMILHVLQRNQANIYLFFLCIYLFIDTIFQEGDIFSSTASLPYDPLNI